MKIVEKERFDNGEAVIDLAGGLRLARYIDYSNEKGRMENGWRLFIYPSTIGHEHVPFRRQGGGWVILATGHPQVEEIVAGPFPCRAVALAVWRMQYANR